MGRALGKILVVDDDRNLLEVLKMRLESVNYQVVSALNERDAIKAVREQTFDVSIIDQQLADQDGISLMEEVHQISPDIPVIILTAYGSIESAVAAMKKGAYNYLTKPFDHRELLMQIEKAFQNRKLIFEIERLKGLLEKEYDFANIVANSEKMQRILAQVSLVAKTESTIFIYG